jgi:hypothetical protein
MAHTHACAIIAWSHSAYQYRYHLCSIWLYPHAWSCIFIQPAKSDTEFPWTQEAGVPYSPHWSLLPGSFNSKRNHEIVRGISLCDEKCLAAKLQSLSLCVFLVLSYQRKVLFLRFLLPSIYRSVTLSYCEFVILTRRLPLLQPSIMGCL